MTLETEFLTENLLKLASYVCDDCLKNFSNMRTFFEHRRHHCEYLPKGKVRNRQQIDWYSCPFCPDWWRETHSTTRHLIMHIYISDDTLYCKGCSEEFVPLKRLNCENPYEYEMFKCEFCPKDFYSKEQLALHMHNHKGEALYECKICDKKFIRPNYLRRHLQIHSSDKRKLYQCRICSRNFSCNQYLQSHMQSHSGNLFTCNHCSKTFVQECLLKNHIRWVHAKDDILFPCDICPKVLSSLRSLRYHKIIHTADGCSKCPYCDRKFSRQVHLNRHVENIHMRTRRLFTCRVCKQSFITVSELRMHRQLFHTYSGEKRFQCDLCGKGFTNKCNFNYHRSIHMGDLQFPCNTCDKKFVNSQRLEKHMLTHMNPDSKPFICEFCSKTYKTKNSLRYHRYVHTGDAPYACSLCPKRFTFPKRLQTHLESHKDTP